MAGTGTNVNVNIRGGRGQGNNTGLNIGHQDPKWIDLYYNDYVRTANAAGVPVLDKNVFYQTYGGNGEINFENVRGNYETELFPKITDYIDSTAQQIANITGGNYIPYQGATDRESLIKAANSIKSTYKFTEDRAYNQYVQDTKKAGGTPLERSKWTPSTPIYEAPTYKFEMPTEWQTLEDMAKSTVEKGEPTLDPNLVNQWEGKLETSYAPVREKLKQNMANYWATLFPQGGGSGKQAEANMGQLSDFETNKLNTALGMAQTDLANKLAAFGQAQKQLSDIGTFKASADQFKSQQDAANYWNTISQNWTQSKYLSDIENSQRQYQQQADLAKYLAEISKPQQPDLGTQLLGGLAGGLGMAGGYAGMGKILSLLKLV